MSPERFRVENVSAAEGVHYAEMIKEVDNQMRTLRTDRIKSENAKLRPVLEKMLDRKKQK